MIKHGVAKGAGGDDREEIEAFLRADKMPDCKEKYEQLVLINPDDYRSWNELKKVFLGSPGGSLEEQLLLTQKAIMVNPKSYFAWHHRYYLGVNGGSRGCASSGFIAHEQRLCSLLLSVDPRNFHCWNYCNKSGIPVATDYANYSSLRERNNRAAELLYTDPDDEGSWRFYARTRRGGGPFHVRKHEDCVEVIFREAFCGEIRVDEDHIAVEDYTMYYKHSRAGGMAASMAVSIRQSPHSAFNTYCLQLQESDSATIRDILELQPSCIFAIKEQLVHTKNLEDRRAIIDRLCGLDRLRQTYYRSLLDGYYEVYIIKEQ